VDNRWLDWTNVSHWGRRSVRMQRHVRACIAVRHFPRQSPVARLWDSSQIVGSSSGVLPFVCDILRETTDLSRRTMRCARRDH
jgi:hypothetical protein